MQLKLKQNPQTSSVFQRKQLKPKPLNHIVQLTQQNQTCRHNPDDINIQKIKLIKKQSGQSTQQQIAWWKKYLGCMSTICKNFGRLQFNKKQIDVNESEFTQLVQKIRNKKTTHEGVLPPQKQQKRILVLDLDQTLVHTTFNKPQKYDFQTEVNFNGKITKVYSIKRFGLDSFLFQMSQIYEIIIFTASQKQYADKVIAQIDPRKRISHVLHRDHCLIINKTYYLKNLKILGRDLKQTILVDDNKMAGILQPQNFYKIEQFLGNPKDRKLVQLSSFLKYLKDTRYILPVVQSRKKFQQMQIKIKQQNTNKSKMLQQNYKRSLQQKKRYRHQKKNSQLESLVTQMLNNTQGDAQKQKELKQQVTQPSQSNENEQNTGHDLIRKKF